MDKAHACDSTTPRTRTVGFDVSPTPRASDGGENGRGTPRSGVFRELRRMAEEAGAAPTRGTRESGDGCANTVSIPRASEDREREGYMGAVSRSPVMILPVRASTDGGAKGGAREREEATREEEGEREVVEAKDEAVEALAREVEDKASVTANARRAEGEAGTKKEKKKKEVGPPRDIPPPKPKMTKAERRALQEAQRAAKAAAKAGEGGGASGGAKKAAAEGGGASGGAKASASARGADEKASTGSKKKVPVTNDQAVGKLISGVSHLRGASKDCVAVVKAHPTVERLALNYARGKTKGARERLCALLNVLRTVVETFEVPADGKYALSLTHHLNQVVHALDKARPMGVAMGNAVRSLKTHLARLSKEENQSLTNEACTQKTLMHIDYFIKEKLDVALESIVATGVQKIENGDVIVTHGASKAVRDILVSAHRAGIKFTVTVVDSRPSNEGPGILSDLCAQGIDCVFTALNGLSYSMENATKVMIGAAACLSNGVVLSRIGSSAVAHAAVARSIPVYIAAETCKFSERVQFDAFAFNELGDVQDVINIDGSEGVLAAVRDAPNLSIMNLTYDAIPCACVQAIICEAGEIRPQEVPCYIPH